MTSAKDISSDKGDQDIPATSISTPKSPAVVEYEQARQRFAERHSAHPLYAARAAKDPDFWKTFSVGGLNF